MPSSKPVSAKRLAASKVAQAHKETAAALRRAVQSTAAKVPTASLAAKAAPGGKAKKPKLVRDSFTIPKAEYLVIEQLKQRTARLGRQAKKSELLRAGIKTLAGMSESSLTAALAAVPSIKTGRPRLVESSALTPAPKAGAKPAPKPRRR